MSQESLNLSSGLAKLDAESPRGTKDIPEQQINEELISNDNAQ